jgi:hypothetical protein
LTDAPQGYGDRRATRIRRPTRLEIETPNGVVFASLDRDVPAIALESRGC